MSTITGNINSTMNPFSQNLTGTIEKAVQIIDSKETIPKDARKAIKDFIKDSFQEIVENLNDLTDIIPEPILEYADLIIEVIRSVI